MNICENCGKETKNKKYCSIDCKKAAMRMPRKPCPICGKEVPRVEMKYCSKECSLIGRKQEYEKSLVYNNCIICGKPTLNEKYCSMKCLGKDTSRHEFATKNLKNEHSWTEEERAYLEKNYGDLNINEIAKHLNLEKTAVIAYASKNKIVSKRKWTEEEVEYLQKNKDEDLKILTAHLQKSVFAIYNKFARLNGFQDMYGNSAIAPQQYIYEFMLNDLNLDVQNEVRIGKYITDILYKNIDFEVQGIHWHFDERFYDVNNLSQTELKRITKDKNKKEALEKKGYKVVYISEYDLVSNPQKVKKQIIELIEEHLKDEINSNIIKNQDMLTKISEMKEIYQDLL